MDIAGIFECVPFSGYILTLTPTSVVLIFFANSLDPDKTLSLILIQTLLLSDGIQDGLFRRKKISG